MATKTQDRRNSKSLPGLNVTNDDALRELVAEHKRLKQIERDAADAERKRKDIESQLRAAMGDEEQIVIRGVVVAKLSSQRHSTIVDQKLLLSAFPEAHAAVVSQKPYRFVQVL
ncbi:hypothetical protein SEA_A3WALLY_374 [Microbacterium phage A3Wally]|nr:hypothetical protein SEA_A3WALLY_374 [Microbacterium phage A3Wally]